MESIVESGAALSRSLGTRSEHIPPIGVARVFMESSPSHLLWCNPSKETGELIETSMLADTQGLMQLLDPLFESHSLKKERARVCSQLGVIAEQSSGGAAFLTLLNNSICSADAKLGEAELNSATQTSAIFDAALNSAEELQRRLIMFARLPWAQSSLQHAANTKQKISVPIVTAASLTDEHWQKREQLMQLLTNLDIDEQPIIGMRNHA